MPRGENLRGKGGPGRPKGRRNNATLEAKELAEAIIHKPEYLGRLAQRVNAGKAPHMETLLWHYAKGKPKEQMELDANVRGSVIVKFVDA